MFEEYNQKMIRLTNKHRKVVMQDDAAFEHDKKLFPGNPVTVNEEPVWYTHPAKELLKRDVKNGLASSLKPSELRDTRPECKEFSVKSSVNKFIMKNSANVQNLFGSGFAIRMRVKCMKDK